MPDPSVPTGPGGPGDGYVGRRRHSADPDPDSAAHPVSSQGHGGPGAPDAGHGHDGADADDGHSLLGEVAADGYDDDGRPPVFAHGHDPRRRRRGGGALIAIVAAVLVAGLVLGGALMLRGLLDRDSGISDYSGEGTGSTSIVVNAGDSLTQIASTLADADVIARPGPFLDAAKNSPAATSIQPGTYSMRLQMSGAAALRLILDPATRTVIKVTIPEGYRIDQVRDLLAELLQVPADQVSAALADIPALGIPAEFGPVASAEGFLYPATYDFQPGTAPATAVRAMVQAFVGKATSMGFVAKAKAQGVTPYQALIIASMAEAEAANEQDWAKVSRVIYNRAQQQMPFGIDATSTYEARVNGADPLAIDYQVPTPYNTRIEPGYPPTPIGNPGAATMSAAVAPAAGDWLYYVQTDAAGTLSFTADFATFEGWAQDCQDNSWGNC